MPAARAVPAVPAGKPAPTVPPVRPPQAGASSGRGAGAGSGARASGDARPTRARPPAAATAATVADDAGGLVLALVVWGWVILPFLKGGPGAVKNTLRAKFLNKAPDGSWLP